MKNVKIIALLCLSLSALSAQEASSVPNTTLNPAISKETISLRMLSFVLPEYINSDVITGFFGVQEPTLLYYGMRLSPLLGYAYTGDWLKLGIGLPLCAVLRYGVQTAVSEPDHSFAASIMHNTSNKLVMYSTYDIYSTLRSRTQAGAYKYEFAPVSAARAMAAPFRYDFLADPYVSIGLASLGAGALAYQWLSGGLSVAGDSPGGNTARWRGADYGAAGGTALYWMESLERNYCAAVGEEAYYRGYILPELVEYLGPVAGIGVNAALFSFAHYSKGDNLLDLALTYLPVSIYYGILAYSNSFDFRKGAFIHFYYNLLIQGIDFITRKDIKFTGGGLSALDGASFSMSIDL